MSRAEELAQKLADMTSKHKAPSHERGVLNGAVEELRRLAQVEAEHEALKKAISDAVPVAWLESEESTKDWPLRDLFFGFSSVAYSSRLHFGNRPNPRQETRLTPLYTLEGIRTKP